MDVALSDELLTLAREHGWPDDLLQGALANGVQERTLLHALKAGLDPAKARLLRGTALAPVRTAKDSQAAWTPFPPAGLSFTSTGWRRRTRPASAPGPGRTA